MLWFVIKKRLEEKKGLSRIVWNMVKKEEFLLKSLVSIPYLKIFTILDRIKQCLYLFFCEKAMPISNLTYVTIVAGLCIWQTIAQPWTKIWFVLLDDELIKVPLEETEAQATAKTRV